MTYIRKGVVQLTALLCLELVLVYTIILENSSVAIKFAKS
jgi:hypothetical protein